MYLWSPCMEILGCLFFFVFPLWFPSYFKESEGGFTLLSFWASPAEWEEISQHTSCLVIMFLPEGQTKSQRITCLQLGGSREAVLHRGSLGRWWALTWDRSRVWNQSCHSPVYDLEQVIPWAVTFFFFFLHCKVEIKKLLCRVIMKIKWGISEVWYLMTSSQYYACLIPTSFRDRGWLAQSHALRWRQNHSSSCFPLWGSTQPTLAPLGGRQQPGQMSMMGKPFSSLIIAWGQHQWQD